MALCLIQCCGLKSRISLGKGYSYNLQHAVFEIVCHAQSKTETRLILIMFIDHKNFS